MGRNSKIKDGDRFGNLTVIKRNGSRQKPSGKKDAIFLCRCDCGNLKDVRADYLSGGVTKSCGCLSKRKPFPNNEATINKIILSYKKCAKRRGISWGIKDTYAKELISKECFYCGVKFSNEWDGYKYNGIDRVDNDKGYEDSNVVPCCKICNIAKHDMKQKDFVIWARTVAEHTTNLF